MLTKPKVLILAAGESSRFYPFNLIHKSFFSIAGKTIIGRTIENIIKNTQSEVVVILNKDNFNIENKMIQDLGFGKRVVCITQSLNNGMAGAILSAKEYLKDNFFVINPQQDNFHLFMHKFMDDMSLKKAIAVVGSQETDTPWKYGILKFSNNQIVGVVEKPKNNLDCIYKRIVGMYYFDYKFVKILEDTKVSEYSLESALSNLSTKKLLSTVSIDQLAMSLKYPWDLFLIKDLIFKNIVFKIDKTAEISKTAVIRGDVYIGKNAKIYDFTIIEGPVYIGDNCVVGSYSQIRDKTILENGSVVQRYVDIKNSILSENSSIHSGFIGDSIIGKNVKIGAGFITANKRLDRRNIKVKVKDNLIETDTNKLGIMIGDNSILGINVSSMPGSILKDKSLVYPGTIIKGTN